MHEYCYTRTIPMLPRFICVQSCTFLRPQLIDYYIYYSSVPLPPPPVTLDVNTNGDTDATRVKAALPQLLQPNKLSAVRSLVKRSNAGEVHRRSSRAATFRSHVCSKWWFSAGPPRATVIPGGKREKNTKSFSAVNNMDLG